MYLIASNLLCSSTFLISWFLPPTSLRFYLHLDDSVILLQFSQHDGLLGLEPETWLTPTNIKWKGIRIKCLRRVVVVGMGGQLCDWWAVVGWKGRCGESPQRLVMNIVVKLFWSLVCLCIFPFIAHSLIHLLSLAKIFFSQSLSTLPSGDQRQHKAMMMEWKNVETFLGKNDSFSDQYEANRDLVVHVIYMMWNKPVCKKTNKRTKRCFPNREYSEILMKTARQKTNAKQNIKRLFSTCYKTAQEPV